MRPADSYKIKLDDNDVEIDYTIDGYTYDYPAGSINSLADTYRERPGISDVINHICRKSWSTLEMLYDLAKLIQEHNPGNTINWIDTFFEIELKLDSEKGRVDTESLSEVVNQLNEEIQWRRNARADEKVINEIKERVKSKLKVMNII